MSKKNRNQKAAVIIVLVALALAGAWFTGLFRFSIMNECIRCHALQVQFVPGQYEYEASFNYRCQEPPEGVGAASYSGLIIFQTPGDLQLDLQSTYINKTAHDPFSCSYPYCGRSVLYAPLYGSTTSTDNDVSPNVPITRWGFYLPATSEGFSSGQQCSYAYHVAFVKPPAVCTPNWVCGAYGTCSAGLQERTCSDGCGATRTETQACNETAYRWLVIDNACIKADSSLIAGGTASFATELECRASLGSWPADHTLLIAAITVMILAAAAAIYLRRGK